MKPAQIVSSDYTSEEMWAEGGCNGSIDPYYPSKVTQAHIHNLIFKKSAECCYWGGHAASIPA